MRRSNLWIITLALAASTAAMAQVAEFSVSGGANRLRNNGIGSLSVGVGASGNDVQLDNGWEIAFRMTINNWKFFGHEFGYAYNRTHLLESGQDAGGMAMHQGFYDMLAYALPEGSKVRPFACGGVQFTNFVPPGTSVTQGGGNTKFGVNIGLGIKAKVNRNFEVRFDVRDYESPKPFGLPGASGWLHQLAVTAGVGIVL